MKVLSSTSANRPDMGRSQGKSEKAELFSQLLDQKRKNPSADVDPAGPATPLVPGGEGGATFESFTKEPEAVAGPSAWPKVTELAHEIVEHISSSGTHNAPAINIEFKSQTLEGLQVQVKSLEGFISVNFFTAVPHVAELLSNHLDGLRLALENRGVRVRQLRISSRGAGAAAKNTRWTR